MPRLPIAAALLPLLLTAAVDPPFNWGTYKDSFTQGSDFAASKAVCRRIGAPRPPTSDLPAPAQRAALKGCDAQKLYYGQSAKPDYGRARQCAFVQPPNDEVFGGATILMQVYANGLGVKKDLDLATAYACTLEGAAMEDDGRVKHLQALKTKPEKARFDYCDDITSGLAQGYCAGRDAGDEDRARNARLAAVTARLPPEARPLYANMKRTFDAFVRAHVDGEVDLSGTARAAEEFQEEGDVRDAFLKELTELLAGRWPAATAAQARAADVQLNAAYRKTLAAAVSKDNFSTVKPDAIRTTQRVWLAWRDAYARFAPVAKPGVSGVAVLERLTAKRAAQLSGLVG